MNLFVRGVNDVVTTTTTENGAVAYTTTMSACVDLFGTIGALRAHNPLTHHKMFAAAFKQNPEVALRIALYSRDVRQGQGERQTFRNILSWLEQKDPGAASAIMAKIPELGRWDDLFVFTVPELVEQAVILYAYALNDGNGLAAKWAPRESSKKSTHVAFRNELMKFMNLSPRSYRKLVAGLSKTVEQDMCAKKWDEINYSHVPSIASSRLKKAFKRHDGARYDQFLNKVIDGTEKINAGAIYPHQVIATGDKTADAMWKNLPDFVPEGKSFIPLVDVSGSMDARVSPTDSTTCMDVSVALGLYLSERNKSAFKDIFLTFETTPKMVKVDSTLSINDRAYSMKRAPWGGCTNVTAAFEMILYHAKTYNVPPEDMPSALIVLSDMEFDMNTRYDRYSKATNKNVVTMFEEAGYAAPTLVWWNLQSRNLTHPCRADEKGNVLVSGFSPSVMKTVLAGNQFTPTDIMLQTVMSDRYDF
jgi:hypothetical protein